MLDILIVGGGPAGLALAAACADQGLSVACLVPDPDEAWPNNYGAWVQDLSPLQLQDSFEQVWGRTQVQLDDQRGYILDRAYGRLDNHKLRAHLLHRLSAHGAPIWDDCAVGVEHSLHSSTVIGRSGQRHTAAVVVDATGHQPALLVRGYGRPIGWQTAFGMEVEVDGHDLDLDTVVFMDFRSPTENASERDPTFLYAMPMGPRRLFVEETSLVAHPAPPFDFLRDRLEARLERMGIRPLRAWGRERCLIPMGAPLPQLPQRVVGFGASASMVHPATGYLLGRTLRIAPRVAATLAQSLRTGQPPERVARDAWAAIWPEDALASRELFLFGTRAVTRMGLERTRDFFSSFFSLPRTAWTAYLDGESPPGEIAGAMARLFLDADTPLRSSLIAASLGSGSLHLLRSFARI